MTAIVRIIQIVKSIATVNDITLSCMLCSQDNQHTEILMLTITMIIIMNVRRIYKLM